MDIIKIQNINKYNMLIKSLGYDYNIKSATIYSNDKCYNFYLNPKFLSSRWILFVNFIINEGIGEDSFVETKYGDIFSFSNNQWKLLF